jgi:hypothetical protein
MALIASRGWPEQDRSFTGSYDRSRWPPAQYGVALLRIDLP